MTVNEAESIIQIEKHCNNMLHVLVHGFKWYRNQFRRQVTQGYKRLQPETGSFIPSCEFSASSTLSRLLRHSQRYLHPY